MVKMEALILMVRMKMGGWLIYVDGDKETAGVMNEDGRINVGSEGRCV